MIAQINQSKQKSRISIGILVRHQGFCLRHILILHGFFLNYFSQIEMLFVKIILMSDADLLLIRIILLQNTNPKKLGGGFQYFA